MLSIRAPSAGVKRVWEAYRLRRIYDGFIRDNPRTSEILAARPETIDGGSAEERSLPGDPRYASGGWREVMLTRYGLAMSLSRGKRVLDTCSGLGWGAYLLDSPAAAVACLEIDPEAIDFARKHWPTTRTEYLRGSVLEMPFAADEFEVVTAMESIEHFDLPDIRRYIGEIRRVLKPEGALVGSSSFPRTEEEAEKLRTTNPHHRHICTGQEIQRILHGGGFRRVKLFSNRLFFIAHN